ncbi:TPR repeat-containing thioredoxin TTL1 [Striga hermonthica]|uniref:TPR repeat-containing thioredoxin TTL1 n=1 Tax=Striga hermonthica TaxID=68872 RepID=A0A9N7NIZ1_STRHE|nr:TPR repeat-containing thioredoxin TTL1 [Striga hermonthica]
MASRTTKPDVLGSGSVNYGHNSIMRGGGLASKPASNGGSTNNYWRGLMIGGDMVRRRSGVCSNNTDPEELKRMGNDNYKHGHFAEALTFYDKAISISPANCSYHFNRAAALMGLRRLVEAVRECEEAIRLEPGYIKAHHRLGSLFLRAEALLKLHQLDDSFSAMSNIPKSKSSNSPHPSQKVFEMTFKAYILFVRTQVELSKGR